LYFATRFRPFKITSLLIRRIISTIGSPAKMTIVSIILTTSDQPVVLSTTVNYNS